MKKENSFRLFGIFGYPLGHTLSPVMQEAAFEKLGIQAYYLPFEMRPAPFRKVMNGIHRLILDGFNVTVPYKTEVISFLDGLTPDARIIGAVNTVFRKGRKWRGANTDWEGFLRSLKKEGGFSPRGKRVLILGAGGSARAVVFGLAKSSVGEINIAARRLSRARKIAGDFRPRFPGTRFQGLPLAKKDLRAALEDADLVVNATSAGVIFGSKKLLPDSLIPRSKRNQRKFFFDLVYPRGNSTPFLKSAKAKGHRILNGTGMLVYQGARAFEYWTGRKAPAAVMRRALENNFLGTDFLGTGPLRIPGPVPKKAPGTLRAAG